jgi:FixJ family two-component response regulator
MMAQSTQFCIANSSRASTALDVRPTSTLVRIERYTRSALLRRAVLERSSRALGQQAEARTFRTKVRVAQSTRARGNGAGCKSPKKVVAELDIIEITVKAHRGQVMRKTNALSFAHLVKMVE